MNGRVYDPVTGRFLSTDPVLGDLNDSQRLNPYSYVSNRPLVTTDPTHGTQ
jgi:RHS repeat-associated protein